MKNEINQTWFFEQSPREVWAFLTQPDLLEQWLGKTDFRPVVGHRFQFASPYGNHSSCEVLEIEPFKRLSFSWRKRSLEDDKPFYSIVTWTLVETEEGTELHLLHSGFTAQEDFAGHDNGWGGCYAKLKEQLTTINR